MNLNDDVVYRGHWLGPLHQLHPGRSRILVRHHHRLHRPPPRVWYVVIFRILCGPPSVRRETRCLMTSGYETDAIDLTFVAGKDFR
jgi:hypothetical protein